MNKFTIYGLETTRSEMCAATAASSDRETAAAIAALYVARGLIARICNENGAVVTTIKP